eukprot:5927098-Prymnesium_polylepis.1
MDAMDRAIANAKGHRINQAARPDAPLGQLGRHPAVQPQERQRGRQHGRRVGDDRRRLSSLALRRLHRQARVQRLPHGV